MRKIAVAVLILLLSGKLEAQFQRPIDDGSSPEVRSERIARSRHYTIDARFRDAIEKPGVEVRGAATKGRVLVRVAPGVAIDERFEALTADRKIDRRALREAAKGRTFARVNVFFHADVPFDAAREVIVKAGGALRDPLQVAYSPSARVSATVPATAIRSLASDERVLYVYGPVSLRQASDNAVTASVSNVDDLYAAPYNLNGEGVAISFFELAPALATHAEFGGRLTVHDVSGSATGGNADHATHVAGTLIASGVQAAAKGMAPAATAHEFDANDDGDFGILLGRKEGLSQTSAIADSNSWGYVLGWCTAPSCEGWVWDDTSEYYGAYDAFFSAPLDSVARDLNVLMIHSAGNDADKLGPRAAPFAHKHGEETQTYCYADNAGVCPATPCTAGAQFCETVRHPQITSQLPAPWISVGLISSAKNVLTVGAVSSDTFIADFSSRGPTRDGRVKPEIVARGVSVYSTSVSGSYTTKSGTSMSTPAVTGTAALLTQQWRRTNAGANPRPDVLKSILLAGTVDLGNPGPDYIYGFGLMDAKASADLIIANGSNGQRVKTGELAQGATYEVPVTISTPQKLRVVLNWIDPEVLIFASDDFATSALVNDLDVKIVNASGQETAAWKLDVTRPDVNAVRGRNTVDNTEMVEIANAAPGTYRIVVTASRITTGPTQKFALVANAPLQADAPPCIDSNEPNGTEATATTLGATASGRLCESSDLDFFRFTATKQGPVSVTVTAATAVRATLTNAGSRDIAAGGSATLNTDHTSNTATTYSLRIEPLGTLGADTSYTITATYPTDTTRRRAASH